MIYVASSWRNERYPAMIRRLLEANVEVYDFRNPVLGDNGFSWREIDPAWESWTPEQFRNNLGHPTAKRGFAFDYAALNKANAGLCMLPAGRSAHIEFGYLLGQGKPGCILLAEGQEPELMYSMSTYIALNEMHAVNWCRKVQAMALDDVRREWSVH